MTQFWDDQWPSRMGPDGKIIPRIWKDPRKPDPDDPRYTFERFDGRVVTLVDEHGDWRYPWWYRIPGWVACYTDSFESALAIVNKWWVEEWLIKHFPDSKHVGHSSVSYPWLADVKFTDYKPPGVYC